MERNVGNVDRTARIVLGLVLLGAVAALDSQYRWLGLIGLVPLATGLMRWCPAYTLFGIDTCGAARKAG
jgi:hypothetical protein